MSEKKIPPKSDIECINIMRQASASFCDESKRIHFSDRFRDSDYDFIGHWTETAARIDAICIKMKELSKEGLL